MSRRRTVLAVTIVGLAVVFAAAVVVSFADQYGLARYVGWGPRLAWLLPTTIDVYAIVTTVIWLAGGRDLTEVQRHARAHATVALGLSVLNNVAFRAIEAHAWNPGAYRWVLVVVAAAVPPAAVGALAHLAVMLARGDDRRPAPDLAPGFARWVVPAALLPASSPAHRNVPPTDLPLSPLQVRALEAFREELEAGNAPRVRAVKARLRIGSGPAAEVAAFLRSRVRS